MSETWTVRGWITGSGDAQFVEAQTGLFERTAPVGVCISGGGTRSMAAGMGQLRGLHALGLLDRVRYLSCVSGGSWLCTAFTFYADGSADDEAFLGPVTAPGDVTMAGLRAAVPRDCVGWTATRPIGPALWAAREAGAPPDRVWVEAIGRTFLQPWGLHTPGAPVSFTQDARSLAEIGARNPALDLEAFHRVRAPERRPFLIINTVIVGIPGLERLEVINPTPMEITPLYSGSPYGREVLFRAQDRSWRSYWLGGGMVESWALGCGGGVRPAGPDTYVVDPADRPYALADASGTSSAFYAGLAETMSTQFSAGNPTLKLRPVREDAPTVFSVGDGGVLDNFGLLALLRRRVSKVVVFVNTATRLNLEYDAATQTPEDGDIDAYLAALFGFCVPRAGVNTAGNHVFSCRDFVPLVEALQAARRAGGPVVAKTTLTLLPNVWWQIEGGWDVEIVWFYLETSTRFEDAIEDDAVRAELDKRRRPLKPAQGKLVDFPNYSTTFASGADLMQLNPEQVKLLADLTCWNVMQSEALLAPWFAD